MSTLQPQETGQDSSPPSRSHSRLTLHIPNAYPRSLTSPRSASPSSPRARVGNGTLPYVRTEVTPAENITGTVGPSTWKIQLQAVLQFIKSQKTSAESARDFLARERTFFSWLRLSMTLSVASAALFFRLQIKQLSNVFKSDGARSFDRLQVALQQKALRKQFMLPRQSPSALHQHAFSVGHFQTAASASVTIKKNKDAVKSILDTNVILSRGLGIAFLLVALACLAVGYFDYIRCERALEQADKLVPFTSTRSGDDGHPENVERREVARKWHDGRMARNAHSSM